MIPRAAVNMHLYVDACLTGIGATNGERAYWKQVCPIVDPVNCITELEGANVGVALATFTDESNRGQHVRVHCDNESAVCVFTSGKGRNKVLLDSARKVWLIQARHMYMSPGWTTK